MQEMIAVIKSLPASNQIQLVGALAETRRRFE
jgi:hypothetical protein